MSVDVRPYPAPAMASASDRSSNWIDIALICLFLIGLYTHYTPQISEKIPFPSAPAGLAGLIMLWRQRGQITASAFTTLTAVLLLYLLSILSATDLNFLGRRFNGFVQLSYSLIVGYGLFLAVAKSSRRQIAALFLCFSLVILIGCVLEDYTGLRSVSDKVRELLYSKGIYDSDLRDELLYGRIRPKFFASEPASVTFLYSLCIFLWMVASRWRLKHLIYLGLVGAGTFAMPGPTLLLTLLLLLPYALFLAGSKPGSGRVSLDIGHLLKVACLSLLLIGAAVTMANSLFSARLNDITSGSDASFFYRVRGPAIAARYVIQHYPIAGAGLTGEPFIEDEVVDAYLRSPGYSRDWPIVSPATELVINFFFLHWIYLGFVWGTIILAAVTMWLRTIGIPSVAFCWLVWAILGQASGAYVGPLTWAVLYLAGAVAILHQRPEPARRAFRPELSWAAAWRPDWRRV